MTNDCEMELWENTTSGNNAIASDVSADEGNVCACDWLLTKEIVKRIVQCCRRVFSHDPSSYQTELSKTLQNTVLLVGCSSSDFDMQIVR